MLGGACPPAIHSEKVSSSATSLVSATRDLAACTFRKEPKHKKVYDENDAKARRIIELHKAKVARMENEKLRRLNTIEKRKVKEEQRETVEQIKEVTHVLTKEKSKREFMEKVELERLQRARIIAKRREEKQKQIKKAQQDAKNEQLERYAMRREDELWFRRLEESRRAIAAANLKALSSVAVTNSIKRSASNHNANINEAFIRVGSNSRPSTAGRLKPPLPSTVPTVQSIVQPAVQLAPPKRKISYAPSTKVISANEQALEEKAQEALNAKWVKFSSAEAIARSRAATKRRIAAKLANKVVKEKEEEEREKQKKEKVLQLAAIARANLQRAVALRNKRRRQASKKTRVVTQSTSNSASNSPQKDSSSQNSPIRQTAKQTVVKSPPKTEENEEDDAEEDDMDGFLEGEAFSEFLNTAPFNYEEFFASPKVIDLLRFSAEAKRISTAEGFGLAPMEHASCEELGERNCERNGEDAEEEYGKDELEAVNSFAGAFEELYQNITGFSEKQMIKKTMIQDDSNDVNDSKSTGRTIPEDQSKHLSSDQTTSNSSNAGRVGKAKKIPMILQSTPYFGHYKKFENKPLQEYLKESVKEARQVEQQRKAHKRRDIEEAQAADSRQWSDVTNMDAHKPMYPSKEFPRRNTFDSGQDTHLQLPSDHGARSNSLDGDLLDYQQQHKK